MLDPGLSWRTPGRTTYFRKAEDEFPSVRKTEVQDAVGDALRCRSGPHGPNGLKLDFDLADIGYCGICSVEWTIGKQGSTHPTVQPGLRYRCGFCLPWHCFRKP